MTIRTKITPLGSGFCIDKTPIRFDHTGVFQEYVVPTGVKKISVDCVAAKGFGTTAGGGRVECILSVKPADNFRLRQTLPHHHLANVFLPLERKRH